MFCRTCGKEVNDNAVICPHCGCALKNESIYAEVKNDVKKINVMCLVGFILSMASLLIALYGMVAIAGLVLSIVGVVQTNKTGERLRGLGIAGIIVAAVSLIFTLIVISIGISLLSVLLSTRRIHDYILLQKIRLQMQPNFFVVLFINYLTPILVAFAFPLKISLMEYFADAIITKVPCFTASLTYSNFAFAPFAPARDAPLQ